MSRLEDLWRIDGKLALVTGAGRGIGYAVAQLFGEAGARMLLCDVVPGAAESAAQKISAASGYCTDISDEHAVETMFKEISATHGTIDILVHVAAIFPKYEFVKMSAAEWDRLHAVNSRGAFLVMREAVKSMKAGGRGGSIVNISSISGERAAVTHNSNYGASKAVVTNLTRSLSIEVAAEGIRVNAVLPGGVKTEGVTIATTEMQSRGITIGGPVLMPGRLPMGRAAEPEEIASVCLFLAAPASSYITGVALPVDGGFLVS